MGERNAEERGRATFGQYIRAMARDAGLSQAKVARAMGTDQAAVSRMMSGTTVPSIERARQYAEFLGGIIVLVDADGRECELAALDREME